MTFCVAQIRINSEELLYCSISLWCNIKVEISGTFFVLSLQARDKISYLDRLSFLYFSFILEIKQQASSGHSVRLHDPKWGQDQPEFVQQRNYP